MFLSKLRLAGLLLLLLGSCVLLTSNAEAQQVHALLVIMDVSGDPITPSVMVDEENVYGFLQKVRKVYSSPNVKVLRSSAGETTISNIQRQIRALRPGPDDVVFFYFAGHGAMISDTDKRTYLQVSDPASGYANLFRADVEDEITNHNCRLQIIITDCCSSVPPQDRSRKYSKFASPRPAGTKAIKNLFGKHKGLLHVTSATEGQPAWGFPMANRGGLFTETLIAAITHDSDIDGNGFLEWSEVLTMAKDQTQTYWQKLKIDRTDPENKTPQTPKWYSLPDRMDGNHTEFHADLWDMSNRYSDLDVTFKTERSTYREGELLELTVRPNKDCFLTVLNWDPVGNFTQIFPNKFDSNNRLRGGKTYRFPEQGDDYELYLGQSGVERLKVIAVTDRGTSEKISRVLSFSEDSDFRSHSVEDSSSTRSQPRVVPQKVSKKLTKQEKIAKILEDLDDDDWTEEREIVDVQ